MTSEWMKVMLDEIERKKAEAEQARLERECRREEQAAAPHPAPPGGPSDG
jgi:hypothetical protein